jgi:hypothetical protein
VLQFWLIFCCKEKKKMKLYVQSDDMIQLNIKPAGGSCGVIVSTILDSGASIDGIFRPLRGPMPCHNKKGHDRFHNLGLPTRRSSSYAETQAGTWCILRSEDLQQVDQSHRLGASDSD